MPISLTNQPTPVIPHFDESRAFKQSDINKLIYVVCTGSVTFDLNANFTNSKDAEIIIRNNNDSAGAVEVVAGDGVTIDVSGVLGLYVPNGGIGQLKRVGYSNHWMFYGFIEGL